MARRDTCGQLLDLDVNWFALNYVPFVTKHPQKKGIRPIVKQIKYVKGVSCVDQLHLVRVVTSVHNVDKKSACRGQPERVLKNLGRPQGPAPRL